MREQALWFTRCLTGFQMGSFPGQWWVTYHSADYKWSLTIWHTGYTNSLLFVWLSYDYSLINSRLRPILYEVKFQSNTSTNMPFIKMQSNNVILEKYTDLGGIKISDIFSWLLLSLKYISFCLEVIFCKLSSITYITYCHSSSWANVSVDKTDFR